VNRPGGAALWLPSTPVAPAPRRTEPTSVLAVIEGADTSDDDLFVGRTRRRTRPSGEQWFRPPHRPAPAWRRFDL